MYMSVLLALCMPAKLTPMEFRRDYQMPEVTQTLVSHHVSARHQTRVLYKISTCS